MLTFYIKAVKRFYTGESVEARPDPTWNGGFKLEIDISRIEVTSQYDGSNCNIKLKTEV